MKVIAAGVIYCVLALIDGIVRSRTVRNTLKLLLIAATYFRYFSEKPHNRYIKYIYTHIIED